MQHHKTALIGGALSLLLIMPFASQAQEREDTGDGWGLGLGVAARSTLYAGETKRVQPFPYIRYQGERFFVEGPKVGYKIVDDDTFTLSGFVAVRGDGVDVEDMGANALARNGIDRNLLEDRKYAADAGLSASFRTEAVGEFELDVRGDITSTSDGYQASLDYRHPFQVGPVTLIPGVGATAMSKDLANYYYGTLPKEVARGVVDYKPGQVTVPHFSIFTVVPISSKWIGMGGVNVDVLPDEVADSPLIEKDTDAVGTFFFAVIRQF
jgi:outer membrane protein